MVLPTDQQVNSSVEVPANIDVPTEVDMQVEVGELSPVLRLSLDEQVSSSSVEVQDPVSHNLTKKKDKNRWSIMSLTKHY